MACSVPGGPRVFLDQSKGQSLPPEFWSTQGSGARAAGAAQGAWRPAGWACSWHNPSSVWIHTLFCSLTPHQRVPSWLLAQP